MAVTPVRLVLNGEKAHRPSIANRAMTDVLSGSQYAADGTDFAGFAKADAFIAAITQWAPRLSVGSFAGRNYVFYGGVAVDAAGNFVRTANGSLVVADNTVSYVERTYDGVVSTNTVGFSRDKIPMAKVTAAANAITVIEDWRPITGPFPYYPTQANEVGVVTTVYPVGNVKRYGAIGDNIADDTIPAQNAATSACAISFALGLGAEMTFPRGNFKVLDELLINRDRIHIKGIGKAATTVTFNPAVAKSLFKFQSATVNAIIVDCSLKDMVIVGAGAQQKVAIDIIRGSEFELSNIGIASMQGNSGNVATPSIGLRTAGHQSLKVEQMRIYADRPIHLTPNAVFPTQGADHFHFTNLYWNALVAAESGMLIDPTCIIFNLSMDGEQAWVGGQNGIKWLTGAGAIGVAQNISIANYRYEQPMLAGGFAIDLQFGGGMYQILMMNGSSGGSSAPGNNGVKVRGARKITMLDCSHSGAAGTVAMDIDETNDELHLINTLFQDGSTVNIGTLERIFAMPKRNAGAPLPPTAYFCNPATGVRGLLIGTGNKYTYSALVAAGGGVLSLPATHPGFGFKAGILTIAGYAAVGPISEGGVILLTPAGAFQLSGTANFSPVNAAGKLCTIAGAPTVVINNTAQPLNVVVSVEWT